MSRLPNPYARGFRVEDHIDRGRTKENRRARDAELEARARESIQAVLAGCEDGLRDDLSLELIDAAAEAAGRLHDPETLQARLGRVAHQRGAEIRGARHQQRAVADAHFNKGSAQ